ncbi:rhomboid family intramembrane serine protease [Thermococcus sp.]
MGKLWVAVRSAPATYSLFAANFMVFLYELYLSRAPVVKPIAVLKLGLFNLCVTECHQYWRLVSAMFVHLGWIHFALNMFFLIYLGSQLEILVGKLRFLTVYFLAGILGNIMSVVFFGPYSLSGGASGALFGVVGALIIIDGVLKKNIQVALVNAFFLFLINSWMPHVNFIAHLGGLIVGLLLGYPYAEYVKGRMMRMEYWEEV